MKVVNKHNFYPLILCVIFIFIAGVRISFPDLEHGDEYSDANALIAGKNFVRFGFVNLRFLPLFDPQPDNLKSAYTHYPPLSEILNGLLRKLVKIDSLYFFRGVSLLISGLSLIFWYLFILECSGSPLLSFLSTLFYLTNNMFIFNMDGLHQHCYSDFVRNLIFFVFLKVYQSSHKKIWFILLWLFYLILSLITYEYTVYVFLFFLLFNFLIKRKTERLSLKHLFILGLAPVVGFILHFLQNAWFFGSIQQATLDLITIFIQRVAASRDSFLPLTLPNWFKFVFLRNISLVFQLDLVVSIVLFILSFLLFRQLSLTSKTIFARSALLGVILFICGMTWYVLFPSHSLAHAFVNFLARHALPAISLLLACVGTITFSFIKQYDPNNYIGKVLVGLSIALFSIWGIVSSNLPLGREKIKNYQEFLIFKNCLINLKAKSYPTDKIGLNYYRHPFISYYTDRNCVFIPEKNTFAQTSSLPRYFLFFPYRTPWAIELLEKIKEKYTIIEECPSRTFPATIFELNDSVQGK